MRKTLKSILSLGLLIIITVLAGCGSASDDRSFASDSNTNGSTISSNSPNANSQTGSNATDDGNEAPIATPKPSSSPTNNQSNARITSFIWKPESERDGNLVVLVNPIRVRVEVTGDISETLSDSGPSNGKGTTARARHTGCDFGRAIVEFFDAQGRPIPTNNGKLKLEIPDGCKRYEF